MNNRPIKFLITVALGLTTMLVIVSGVLAIQVSDKIGRLPDLMPWNQRLMGYVATPPPQGWAPPPPQPPPNPPVSTSVTESVVKADPK